MTHNRLLYPAAALLALVGGSSLAHADQPTAPTPPAAAALDPSHILCGDQFKADPRSKVPAAKQCMDAANAFYTEEWQAQIQGLLSGSPRGFAAMRPATTFELPDGTLVGGAMLGAYAPTLFGPTAVGATEITPDFTFKPIDRDTILVFGVPRFTIKGRDGSTYVLYSAQLSVYRRGPAAAGSPSHGWEELGELWTYKSETKGPKPSLPPTPPAAPPKPAK